MKKRLYKLYVITRNFFINNFFVNILCIKNEDNFIYLSNNYILLLIPFFLLKCISYLFNYEIIYKIDGVYGITNNKELHIIPFIKNLMIISENSSINITSDIYTYNSLIPLEFLFHICNIKNGNIIKLNYVKKGNNIEKEINIKDINLKKYLIYNLFDEKTD